MILTVLEGCRNWLPTWLGRAISSSLLGKDDRNRKQDNSESIKNLQLVILWYLLNSNTTRHSMAWTATNRSHSFFLFFEKKVFLRPVLLSLTTCSSHKIHTTSHSPSVSQQCPACTLEMQKPWKHGILPWWTYPDWYFTLLSQLQFPLGGTPGSVLPQWPPPSLLQLCSQ